MKCLETRTRPDGLRSRRYLLDDGRRITTLELPESVLKSVGLERVRQQLKVWNRGELQRADQRVRRLRINELLRQDVKPTAIANEVGVTEARVRQIRKELIAARA
jgi:DNA-directed RNA polymerase specialized sigma subunit